MELFALKSVFHSINENSIKCITGELDRSG